ncbi:MAG TPA: FAD binding domain-containing protein [Candidatus Limnocylindrales bacterium]|nr:FAD binding domain-containing protein [Candidatus Limnocylindrales bacterium]
MKPASFEYVRPETVADATSHLRDAQGDAKVLAGGQSLIPLLNFRLASPRMLVDLGSVRDLAYVRASDGIVSVGSMTRMRTLERDARVAESIPALTNAVSWVGHVQIRNRGTVGGSIAHADPAAELPALALLLDGSVTVVGPTGERSMEIDELLLGFFTTALEEDELITEARFAIPDRRATWGFREFAPRHGDFALAGAAVLLTPDDRGRTSDARVVVFGGHERALRARESERALTGSELTVDLADEAAAIAATETLVDDPRPDAAYRRKLTQAMVARALRDALERRTSP